MSLKGCIEAIKILRRMPSSSEEKASDMKVLRLQMENWLWREIVREIGRIWLGRKKGGAE